MNCESSGRAQIERSGRDVRAHSLRAQEPLLELLRKHMDPKGKQAKLKSPQELQELLDVTRYIECHAPLFLCSFSVALMQKCTAKIGGMKR